jgi:hypothetical protein
MELAILIGFACVAYVGSSIARGVYWDIKTRPMKRSNEKPKTEADEEKKKILLRKVNTVRERVE